MVCKSCSVSFLAVVANAILRRTTGPAGPVKVNPYRNPSQGKAMAGHYQLHSSGDFLVATATPVLEPPPILYPRLGMILPTHVVEERAREEFERRQAYTGIGPNLNVIERLVFAYLDGPRDPHLGPRDCLYLVGLSIAAIWAYPQLLEDNDDYDLSEHAEADTRGVARVVQAVPNLATELGVGPPESVQGENLLRWLQNRLAGWMAEIRALLEASPRRRAVVWQAREIAKFGGMTFDGKQCVDTLTGVVGRNAGESDDAQGNVLEGALARVRRGGLGGRERVEYLKAWLEFLSEQVDASGPIPIRYGAVGIRLDGTILGKVLEEAVGRGRPTTYVRLDPDAQKERRGNRADDTLSTPEWILQVRETQEQLEDLPLMRGLLRNLAERGHALPAVQREIIIETMRLLDSNRDDPEFLAAFAHRSGLRRSDVAAAYRISEGAVRGALPRVEDALRRALGRVG